MSGIRTVTLELLRPGPPHNQLLSPLTPYIALCGEGGPTTVYLSSSFEHRRLLNRLERLRYVTERGAAAVPEGMRQTEVQELGSDMARVLGAIPTLNAEVARSGGAAPEIIHIRLVLWGSELALLPFELSNAPEGFPGERLELQLQASAPITITRELRRGRPLPVNWTRTPSVLFAFAAPGGLSVPFREHTHALRLALEPWIRRAERKEERLPHVKKRLTVLPEASLEDIRRACSERDFTHVHILAHGAPYEEAGEQRFGLALCDHLSRDRIELVSGKRLAQALRAARPDFKDPSQPAVVTLATCDSGAPGSVLSPGGSIAHDLHANDIPWVVASQFPLTKVGSVTVVEALYQRLLRGDDPRCVLQDLRQRLFTASRANHDWGSIVAYASLPADFEEQLHAFRERQIRLAVNVAFDWAELQDNLQQMEKALSDVEKHLAYWSSVLPTDDSATSRRRRAECYGLLGVSKKRTAEFYQKRERPKEAQEALESARAWYRKAAETGGHRHWTVTQYLSLTAVRDAPAEPELWAAARGSARSDLDQPGLSERAWAHASLAELALLGTYHWRGFSQAEAARQIKHHCPEIPRLMGRNSFHVFSTWRQFNRYLEPWWDHERWQKLAQLALDSLNPTGAEIEKPKLPDDS